MKKLYEQVAGSTIKYNPINTTSRSIQREEALKSNFKSKKVIIDTK